MRRMDSHLAVAVQAPPPGTSAVGRSAEEAAVRQALHLYVDHGKAAPIDLDVAQIAIDSGYALVTWTHGDQGGQALLRKEGAAWRVLECGPGWLGLRGVCGERVPDEVAKRLLDRIDPNWASYEPVAR